MNKVHCPICNGWGVTFTTGADVLKVKFTCQQCGKVSIIEEIE